MFVFAPTLPIHAIQWMLDRPGQANASAWTGRRTAVTDPWHGKWTAHVDLATQQGESGAAPYMAFLAKVMGSLNTFNLPATAGAQNANSGVTVASSAAQGATSVTITGAATPLTAGQKITINDQLLQIKDVDNTNTLYFEPKLREAANAGTSVETANPYALVYMADTKQGYEIATWRRYGISFDVVEAVNEPVAASAALSLNFTAQRYYSGGVRQTLLSSVSGYTFARTGIEGAANAGGSVAFFAANTPAINTNGYHCFGSLTNELLNSQDFTAWTATSSAVTANTLAAPDGTTTADTLTDQNLGTSGTAFIQETLNFSSSGTKTFSVFAKANGASWLRLVAVGYSITGLGSGPSPECYYDLTNGVVAAATGGGTGRIIPFANGWYLCSLEFSLDGADLTGTMRLDLAVGAGVNSFTRNGTHSLYLWQAQTLAIGGLSDMLFPLIATTSATVTIGASNLQASTTLPSGDFIAWAVIDLPALATVTPFALSTSGTGSFNDVITVTVGSGGSVSAAIAAASVTQPAPANIANPFLTAGRSVVMIRRRNGIYSIAAKNAAGTISIGADASGAGAVPAATTVDIGCARDGTSQINGRVECFFQRNGTFTDADVTAILTAA